MKSLLISLTLAATLHCVPPPVRAASADPPAPTADGKTGGAAVPLPKPAGPARTAGWQSSAPPSRFAETGAMLLAGLGFMGTVTARRSRRRATP